MSLQLGTPSFFKIEWDILSTQAPSIEASWGGSDGTYWFGYGGTFNVGNQLSYGTAFRVNTGHDDWTGEHLSGSFAAERTYYVQKEIGGEYGPAVSVTDFSPCGYIRTIDTRVEKPDYTKVWWRGFVGEQESSDTAIVSGFTYSTPTAIDDVFQKGNTVYLLDTILNGSDVFIETQDFGESFQTLSTEAALGTNIDELYTRFIGSLFWGLGERLGVDRPPDLFSAEGVTVWTRRGQGLHDRFVGTFANARSKPVGLNGSIVMMCEDMTEALSRSVGLISYTPRIDEWLLLGTFRSFYSRANPLSEFNGQIVTYSRAGDMVVWSGGTYSWTSSSNPISYKPTPLTDPNNDSFGIHSGPYAYNGKLYTIYASKRLTSYDGSDWVLESEAAYDGGTITENSPMYTQVDPVGNGSLMYFSDGASGFVWEYDLSKNTIGSTFIARAYNSPLPDAGENEIVPLAKSTGGDIMFHHIVDDGATQHYNMSVRTSQSLRQSGWVKILAESGDTEFSPTGVGIANAVVILDRQATHKHKSHYQSAAIDDTILPRQRYLKLYCGIYHTTRNIEVDEIGVEYAEQVGVEPIVTSFGKVDRDLQPRLGQTRLPNQYFSLANAGREMTKILADEEPMNGRVDQYQGFNNLSFKDWINVFSGAISSVRMTEGVCTFTARGDIGKLSQPPPLRKFSAIGASSKEALGKTIPIVYGDFSDTTFATNPTYAPVTGISSNWTLEVVDVGKDGISVNWECINRGDGVFEVFRHYNDWTGTEGRALFPNNQWVSSVGDVTLRLNPASIDPSTGDRFLFTTFTMGAVPVTQISDGNYNFMVSDGEIGGIQKVFIGTTELNSAHWKELVGTTDTTGNTVSVVRILEDAEKDFGKISDNDVSVACLGRVDSTGSVLTRPAKIIKDFLVSHCEWDAESINEDSLNEIDGFWSQYDIKLAGIIDDSTSVARTLDEIIRPLLGYYTVSDGKINIRHYSGTNFASHFEFEYRDIISPSWTRSTNEERYRLINEVKSSYLYNWHSRRHLSSKTTRDESSMLKYGTHSIAYEWRWVRDEDTINFINHYWSKRYNKPLWMCRFSYAKPVYYLEEGDLCTVTHPFGPGTVGNGTTYGWGSYKGQIVGIGHNFDNRSMSIDVLEYVPIGTPSIRNTAS